MKPLFEDTSPEIENRLLEGYRDMTPVQKLTAVATLNHVLEQLASSRIKTMYGPEMSEKELRLRLASLRLDRDTMIRVFGWDPEIHGY
ncbi:MAG: hypothetical protein FJY97_17110 [candidate division Zixibacteria bacterium]|nr:hypothetical protein [candidate division Zixibacteria bacterium]